MMGHVQTGRALVVSRSCTEASPERFPGGEQQWVYSLGHYRKAGAQGLSRRPFPGGSKNAFIPDLRTSPAEASTHTLPTGVCV